MNVKLKIYFTDKNDKQFMGIGVYWLLIGIKKYGSIRKASEEMRLSYVKALGMLNNLESCLNKKVVLRRRGGDAREGTTLTETGENLVKQYDAYQEKVKSFAEEEFKLLVPHFLD